MVDSDRRWVQLWRRTGDDWVGQGFVGAASFDSAALGSVVELNELYADSGL